MIFLDTGFVDRDSPVAQEAPVGGSRGSSSAVSAGLEVCYADPVLSFTPAERLTDPQGRPYFLWDCDMTLAQFQQRLQDGDPEVRAYLVGKLMRQAKPDDVFLFVRPRVIRELWPRLRPYLGRTREFWTWLFETWEHQGSVWR